MYHTKLPLFVFINPYMRVPSLRTTSDTTVFGGGILFALTFARRRNLKCSNGKRSTMLSLQIPSIPMPTAFRHLQGRQTCRVYNAGTKTNLEPKNVSRRHFGGAISLAGTIFSLTADPTVQPANAVMGMTAGRVPGLSPANADGVRHYTRPEGKSGGHGVGWTEITPYSFDVYDGWEEVPVSIADPGGTEIDARFSSEQDGGLKVVLAPVLRFANIDEGLNPTIEELIPLERFMAGFGPELTQSPVEEVDIIDKFVEKLDQEKENRFQ